MSNTHEDRCNHSPVAPISPSLVHLPDTSLTSMTREEFAAFAKTLSPELLAENINHCHEQAERNALLAEEPLRRWFEWAFAAGMFLVWTKKTVVKHGDLEQWVRDNCRFDERQAQRYMRLVKKWPEIQAKATSEDAFPKSVNGLLGLIAKEKRRSNAKADTQENVQNEGGETKNKDKAVHPKRPKSKGHHPSTRRTTGLRMAQEGDETKEERHDEDTEADEAHEQKQAELAPDETTEEAVAYAAHVTGMRSFFIHPESGYDEANVFHLLQTGQALVEKDFVYLGDKEIAWLEIRPDDLEYSEFRLAESPATPVLCLHDPGSEAVAVDNSLSGPQANSLPFDPHFD